MYVYNTGGRYEANARGQRSHPENIREVHRSCVNQ